MKKIISLTIFATQIIIEIQAVNDATSYRYQGADWPGTCLTVKFKLLRDYLGIKAESDWYTNGSKRLFQQLTNIYFIELIDNTVDAQSFRWWKKKPYINDELAIILSI